MPSAVPGTLCTLPSIPPTPQSPWLNFSVVGGKTEAQELGCTMATELGEELCLNPGFSEAKSKLSALLKCYVLRSRGEKKGTASKGTLETVSLQG